MALFVSATVSASAAEVAAAFAWICGALRIGRGRPPGGAQALALGLTGALLGASRQFGPAWIAATVVVLARAGALRVVATQLRRDRLAAAGAALTGLGAAFGAGWVLLVFPTPPARRLPSSLGGRLEQSFDDLGRLGREAVGVFGWLDTTVPAAIHLGWAAAVVALVGLAWRSASRRARSVLALVAAMALAAPLAATWVAYDIQTGAQGRWLLPIAMAVPLLAGELWAGAPVGPRVGSRAHPSVLVGAVAAVAAGHLTCLWANSRRYAVGSEGPIWFVGASRWAPPGGWAVVAVLATGGAASLVAAAALIATRRGAPAGS
jgi:hypothetical protein